MPEPDDIGTNTPSELAEDPISWTDTGGGGNGGGDGGGKGDLKHESKLLAQALGWTVGQAHDYIVSYVEANGGSYHGATVALQNDAEDGTMDFNPDGNDTGGGGSSGSSGSSSSGGSSGAAPPSPQDLRNAEASYRSILTSWGLPPSKGLDRLINQAVHSGMSTQAFIETVRTTKDYAKAFPGIMKPNGTMRMTESQYIAGYQSARDTAASLGRSLSPQAYGLAIKNGNSPSEIKDKLTAVDTLKQYGPMFENFSEYLMATGVTKKPLTRQELQAFIMGEGPKQFYDAYRTAQAASTVEDMGYTVGGEGADVTFQDMKRISAQLEAAGSSGDYSAVLALSKQVLTEGDYYNLGVTRKDQVKLALGAPGAKQMSEKLQSAVNMKVAASEPRANPQMVQSQTGTQQVGGPQGQRTQTSE